jgi:hypothetical protein
MGKLQIFERPFKKKRNRNVIAIFWGSEKSGICNYTLAVERSIGFSHIVKVKYSLSVVAYKVYKGIFLFESSFHIILSLSLACQEILRWKIILAPTIELLFTGLQLYL